MRDADRDVRDRLLDAARTGATVSDLRDIDATVLRAVLLSGDRLDPPAFQLSLSDAAIHGDLDLCGANVAMQLNLHRCVVEGGIRLLDARTPGLQLDQTHVGWLDAANSVVAIELWLKDSTFRHGLDLTDAQVSGSVHLDGSTFGPDARPAGVDVMPPGCPLRLSRVTINGSLIAVDVRCHGMADLSNARIGGDLELDGAHVSAPAADGSPYDPAIVPATAIHAPNLTVGGSLTADPGRVRTRRTISHLTTAPAHVPLQRRPPSHRTLVADGRLYLPGATVGADLDLTGAHLTLEKSTRLPVASSATGASADAQYDPTAVLILDRAKVRGNIELDSGFACRGVVRLSNARIGGDLRINGATLDGRPAGEETTAPYSVVADGTVIRGQVDASSSRVRGELRLRDAEIGHNVYFVAATVDAPGSNAVNLERAIVGGTIDFSRMSASGSLRLADITCGSVFLDSAVLRDPHIAPDSFFTEVADAVSDAALNLTGATVTGTVRANTRDGACFDATGAVFLRGARVSRAVQFNGARLISVSGTAIDASGLVAASLSLTGLRARSGVRFADAEIAGDVNMAGAELALGSRYAASVDGVSARVNGSAWFDGMSAEGTVRLRRATVLRSVGLKGVRIRSGDLALDLAGLRTPDLVLAPAEPIHGSVDISRVVALAVTDNDNLWANRQVDLWGMEYVVLINADRKTGSGDWHSQLERLRSSRILPPPSTLDGAAVALPKGHLSQPYLQLAAMYRAVGSDGVARRVLYAMRHNEWQQRARATVLERRGGLLGIASYAGNLLRRAVLALTGFLYRITVGYGYRLHRALYWLLGLWLLGLIVFTFGGAADHPSPRPAGSTAGLTQNCEIAVDADPVPDQPGYCGTFVPSLYTIDLILPVVDLGQESAWRYRSVPMQAFGDALQIAGWIMAAAAASAALTLVGRAESDSASRTPPVRPAG